jgi:hypothetical protein
MKLIGSRVEKLVPPCESLGKRAPHFLWPFWIGRCFPEWVRQGALTCGSVARS